MKSPTAVAISASATPPVTPRGSTRPSEPKRWKARIIPVMVPRSPSRGAAVTIVSRAQRPLDEGRLLGGPGLHPPGGPCALVQDHPEEPAEVVARIELGDALLEI